MITKCKINELKENVDRTKAKANKSNMDDIQEVIEDKLSEPCPVNFDDTDGMFEASWHDHYPSRRACPFRVPVVDSWTVLANNEVARGVWKLDDARLCKTLRDVGTLSKQERDVGVELDGDWRGRDLRDVPRHGVRYPPRPPKILRDASTLPEREGDARVVIDWDG